MIAIGPVILLKATLVFSKVRKSEQRDKEMNAEYIASGIVALLLLVYLMYALLKPEKF